MSTSVDEKITVECSWIKQGESLTRFSICNLPKNYCGKLFWSEVNSPFFNVVCDNQSMRVTCASHLIPPNMEHMHIGGLVGFTVNSSSCTLSSLFRKFQMGGLVYSLFFAEADKAYFFFKESDVPLLVCVIEEIWDKQYSFHFVNNPELCLTAQLSRQLTMLAAIFRYYKDSSTVPSSFTIHCLGAESIEYTDFSSLIASYGCLFKCLSCANVSVLHLVFVGPNLLSHAKESSFTFSVESNLTVHASVSGELYHDYVKDHTVPVDDARNINIVSRCEVTVDLIILFQAGLWGYDSWLPTLHIFSMLSISQIVVTSYSLLEGENDYDTLEAHCLSQNASGKRFVWNFEDEKNPYASSEPIPRISAPDCDTYYDNCAWQSVSFIPL